MFLKRLFASRQRPAALPPDLAGDGMDRMRAEMQACLDREGGALDTRRRLAAVCDLYEKLTPEGRRRYLAVVGRLNEGTSETAGHRVARIEEAEIFGRRASRLAILDAFESPRRRLLRMFASVPAGRGVLEALRDGADADLSEDIDAALGGDGKTPSR